MPKKTRAANGSSSAQSATDQEFDAAFEEAQRFFSLKAERARIASLRTDTPESFELQKRQLAEVDAKIAQIGKSQESPKERAARLARDHAGGMSFAEIARREKISRQRVLQLVREYEAKCATKPVTWPPTTR